MPVITTVHLSRLFGKLFFGVLLQVDVSDWKCYRCCWYYRDYYHYFGPRALFHLDLSIEIGHFSPEVLLASVGTSVAIGFALRLG